MFFAQLAVQGNEHNLHPLRGDTRLCEIRLVKASNGQLSEHLLCYEPFLLHQRTLGNLQKRRGHAQASEGATSQLLGTSGQSTKSAAACVKWEGAAAEGTTLCAGPEVAVSGAGAGTGAGPVRYR